MLLCFHGTLIRGARPTLAERVELARRTGYQALDFDWREVRDHVAAHPGLDAPQFWAEAGLAPGMAGGVPIPDLFAEEAEFAAGVAALPAAAQGAAAVGGRLTGVVLANRARWPEPEARELVRARLTRLAEVLGAYGLALAVEFIGVRHLWRDRPHPFCQRYEETLALIEETGRDNIGLLLDSYHWYAAEASLEAVARTPARRIAYLHVNDAKPGPAAAVQDADRLVPGEGVIDLPGWFRAVQRTGFDGCVAPEVLGPRLAAMTSEQAAQSCRAGIVRAMRQAGIAV